MKRELTRTTVRTITTGGNPGGIARWRKNRRWAALLSHDAVTLARIVTAGFRFHRRPKRAAVNQGQESPQPGQ